MINEERISKLTSAVYKVSDLFADKEPLKFAIRRACLDVLSLYVSCTETTSLEAKKQFAQKGEIQSSILLKYFALAEHQDWIDPKNFEILKSEYSQVNAWFSDQSSKIKQSLENRRKVAQKEKSVKRPEQLSLDAEKEVHLADKNPVTASSMVDYSEQLVSSSPVAQASHQVNLSNISQEILVKDTSFDGALTLPSERPDKTLGEIKSKNNLYNIGVAIDYEELSGIQLKILEVLQTKKFLKSGDICNYFEDMSDRNIRREIKELRDKGIVITKGNGRSTYYQLNYIY